MRREEGGGGAKGYDCCASGNRWYRAEWLSSRPWGCSVGLVGLCMPGDGPVRMRPWPCIEPCGCANINISDHAVDGIE